MPVKTPRAEIIARLRAKMKTGVLTKREVCQLERAEMWDRVKAEKAAGTWTGRK